MKRNYLNSITKLAIVFIAITVTSCKEDNGLALEYMPDMFRSPSIETYVDYGEIRGKQHDSLKDVMSARKPVEGTIPRGFTPYSYPNTMDGYNMAGDQLKNPIERTDEVVAKGKELYGMFCVHCHGKTGQGDGSLVERDKFPPLPVKFKEGLDISEGKMFHSVTYGKGLMGPHSSQLNQRERWEIIHYIRAEFMKEETASVEEIEEIGETEEVVEEVAEEVVSEEEINSNEQ